MNKPDHHCVGRDLKASDLAPNMVAWLHKKGRPVMLCRVMLVDEQFVVFRIADSDRFRASRDGIRFIARRTGSNLEQITDDSNIEMRMYEYRGKPL